MNWYQKINQYFLERFPTLWNLHFIWMLGIGFCLHLLYYLLGYADLSIETLKSFSIQSSFYSRAAFLLYLTICLIVLIYFGFRYYTQNPFKNFYPINHFYFWKNFILLFLLTFVFSTVNISFENGMRKKLEKILPKNEEQKIRQTINNAYPFLFNNISTYRIENRIYPAPFPLEELYSIEIGYDSINSTPIYNRIQYDKPYLSFNGDEFQFGRTEYIDIDSCTQKRKIKEYIDVSKGYGIEEFSVYNFSSLFIEPSEGEDEETYLQRWIPEIHKIYKENDSHAVAKILNNLEQLCIQYQISNQLNPEKMSRDIFIQNLEDVQFVSTGFYDYKKEEPPTNSTNIEDSRMGKIKSSPYLYSVDLEKFSNIIRNSKELRSKMGSNYLFDETAWFWIFFSMIASIIFIFTKYIPFKEILIGAVITGILSTLYGVLLGIGIIPAIHFDVRYLFATFIYLILIISIGIRFVYKKSISRSLATKWFTPLIFSLIVLFPVFNQFILEFTKGGVAVPCSDYKQSVYLYDVKPIHIFLMELITIQILFSLLRRLRSKAD